MRKTLIAALLVGLFRLGSCPPPLVGSHTRDVIRAGTLASA